MVRAFKIEVIYSFLVSTWACDLVLGPRNPTDLPFLLLLSEDYCPLSPKIAAMVAASRLALLVASGLPEPPLVGVPTAIPVVGPLM